MISGAAEAFFFFNFIFFILGAWQGVFNYVGKKNNRLTISEGGNIKEKQRLKCECFFDIHEKIKSENSKKRDEKM